MILNDIDQIKRFSDNMNPSDWDLISINPSCIGLFESLYFIKKDASKRAIFFYKVDETDERIKVPFRVIVVD